MQVGGGRWVVGGRWEDVRWEVGGWWEVGGGWEVGGPVMGKGKFHSIDSIVDLIRC